MTGSACCRTGGHTFTGRLYCYGLFLQTVWGVRVRERAWAGASRGTHAGPPSSFPLPLISATRCALAAVLSCWAVIIWQGLSRSPSAEYRHTGRTRATAPRWRTPVDGSSAAEGVQGGGGRSVKQVPNSPLNFFKTLERAEPRGWGGEPLKRTGLTNRRTVRCTRSWELSLIR